MFGPLNGVRVALVVLAGMAALAAAIVGQWMVTGVLLVGIGLHGLLWLRMYQQRGPGDATGDS